jgi:hypothetical protein
MASKFAESSILRGLSLVFKIKSLCCIQKQLTHSLITMHGIGIYMDGRKVLVRQDSICCMKLSFLSFTEPKVPFFHM